MTVATGSPALPPGMADLSAHPLADRPERARRIFAEQVRLLYGDGVGGYAIALIVMLCAAVNAIALWDSVERWRIALWLAGVAACQVGTLLLTRAYRHTRPQPEAAPRWARLKALQSGVLGGCWGLGVILLYDPVQPPTLLYPVISLVALTSASATLNAAYLPSLYAFLGGSLLPSVAYLLTLHNRFDTYVAAALLLLFGFLAVAGRIASQSLRQITAMRLDTAELLARQQDLVDKAEQETALVDAAVSEKTRFWSAASHDLKQPLHALGLYTALLRKDPPEAERRDLIEHVATCVGSLTGLFDAILGVTHAETAHLNAKAQAIPLQRVIDQVLIQLRPSAQAKGLVLRNVPTRLWVHADAAVIERILGNLLSNAVRYTDQGRIVVGVRRRPGACALVVADTGIGLAQHDQSRIFDDFFQANNPERSREKGYGLGLSTVHRLCAALDYDIDVQSTPGKGSLFAITLPLDSPLEADVVNEPLQSLEADLNVLFVEDDPLVRDAMNRMLKDWGVRVCMCETGDEAMAILSQEFDKRWHVLLDYTLADNETGLQIADRIRAVIGDAPLISLVTGEGDPSIDEAAGERGITVLRKPLKPIRLRALLRSHQLGQESVL